jgi:hypothetical protein
MPLATQQMSTMQIASTVQKSTNSLKGKNIPKDLEIFEPTIQREQELSIYIMTVDQNHFLATVIRPLDLPLMTFVKSLRTKDVKKSLKDQTDLLKQENILPTKVQHTSFLNSMTIQHDVVLVHTLGSSRTK